MVQSRPYVSERLIKSLRVAVDEYLKINERIIVDCDANAPFQQ